MPVTKNGQGQIIYTPVVNPHNDGVYGGTGVVPASQVALAGDKDSLIQLKADVSDMATNSTVTIKAGAVPANTNIVITLPATDTTIGPAGMNQLTGDVTAGPGSDSQAATVVSVGGSSAANVHAAELLANAATSANTVSTIVKRDSSGNFSAGTITATLSGNASTATSATTATNFSGSLSGDVTGTQSSTSISAATVTGKAITGFVSGAGTVSASDTVLQAINKLDGNIAGKQASGNYVTALTGDVTASGPGSSSATIANNVVSNAKLAQMATLTIKSNVTGGTANAADNSLSTILDTLSSTQGAVLYRGSSAWTALSPGTNGQVLTSGGAAANVSWGTAGSSTTNTADDLTNVGLAAAVAANAMTINLKQSDGSTAPASGSGAVNVSFRNATATTGGYTSVSTTSAVSITIPSGATLGSTSGNPNWVYVYAINNAGTLELAVAGSKFVDEGTLVSTTAIGAGSTDKTTLYSTTSRSTVGARLLGRVKSTQTTAGTWATSPAEISVRLSDLESPRSEIYVTGLNGTGSSGYGTTNTTVFRFGTQQYNVGTAFTRATSSTAGDSITINEDGIYAMTAHFNGVSTLLNAGWTLNSASLTTSVGSLTFASATPVLLSLLNADSTNNRQGLETFVPAIRLSAGDVLRLQGVAAQIDTSTTFWYRITKIAN